MHNDRPLSAELDYEYQVIYETRLGIMCEDREPTPEQMQIAAAEARQARAVLAATHRPDPTPQPAARSAGDVIRGQAELAKLLQLRDSL